MTLDECIDLLFRGFLAQGYGEDIAAALTAATIHAVVEEA